jgi:hypothetical protein
MRLLYAFPFLRRISLYAVQVAIENNMSFLIFIASLIHKEKKFPVAASESSLLLNNSINNIELLRHLLEMIINKVVLIYLKIWTSLLPISLTMI